MDRPLAGVSMPVFIMEYIIRENQSERINY